MSENCDNTVFIVFPSYFQMGIGLNFEKEISVEKNFFLGKKA